ncbi:hypothetical protein JOB18_040434 [Solea senegalensis]|uniref:CLOCK-interacting pacemaker-like n=1 Tax=Solea senegalensis TaxID=28829 RepID=A0AAV6SHB3_SOLSE|nr:CLOCK-interacting pacemaker-like [Solea senegalensis]XP_043898385.1 CLOCK-interacting pacemaker-like [Solea senegalensis]XP_043898386.1 CLOCK-interacting pacemaker-like [Solea senegalensis]XP_043898387.1 CLOCK-interacting pacemaker-like [Solea senegalensis]KAG7516778.1 CLOCK-interacting pacemaker-like [Solea senegalensis]KAG7516779.1 hypothetical protein JOB18_040434 [Solea senegalensis]KAG7516780.1 hypothetical protein JOB18_040434 [Solea senegalensis]
MPKEQGRFGERAVRSTSKNAKDKSNSATLRASKSGTHMEPPGMGDVSRRMRRCDSEKESEKDSGYSEAGSDFVHTDVDDQRSSVSEPHRQSSKSCSSSNNNNNSANAAGHNMPAYEELTPIYIIKNLVVKPSRPEPLLHGPLAWGGGWHGLTGAKTPTQLLLIQQPPPPPPASSTAAPPTPSSSQAALQGEVKNGGGHGSQSHRSKNSYLPILNSYPRIAPHPRKESHEGKSSKGAKACGGEGQSKSKRVRTEEEKREAVSTTTHLLKPQKECRVHSHSQHKTRGGHHSFPMSPHCPLPTQHKRLGSVGSPSVSSSQMPSPPSSSDSTSSSSPASSSMAHSPFRLLPDSSSARQRRFLNTAEILNQSGLLAITLRTKELLKQNAATEREIAQLRQHTHLLCQAVQANQSRCGDGSDGLDNLLQAMTKSASYPDLDLTKTKALSGVHQESKTKTEEDNEKEKNIKSNAVQLVSLHAIDDGTSPPSPLFAPSPDAEEAQHADDPLDLMSILSFHRSLPELGYRHTFMDKDISDLTMLPESSTHDDYLL